MFLPIVQGNIPLSGNRHNKQRLPGDQNVPQGKPEVREDQFIGGGELGVFFRFRESHKKVEKVADYKKKQTLVKGCGSEISPHLTSWKKNIFLDRFFLSVICTLTKSKLKETFL